MKVIKVEIKNVFGTEKIYPLCEDAKLFASMKSQATLTRADIAIIKNLGYSVEVISKIVTL